MGAGAVLHGFDQVRGGDSHTYHFNLRNHGGTAEQVTLGVTDQLGWTIGVTPTTVLLAPNDQVEVLVSVAVPNPLTSQLPLDHADLRLNSLAELPLAELLRTLT